MRVKSVVSSSYQPMFFKWLSWASAAAVATYSKHIAKTYDIYIYIYIYIERERYMERQRDRIEDIIEYIII